MLAGPWHLAFQMPSKCGFDASPFIYYISSSFARGIALENRQFTSQRIPGAGLGELHTWQGQEPSSTQLCQNWGAERGWGRLGWEEECAGLAEEREEAGSVIHSLCSPPASRAVFINSRQL